VQIQLANSGGQARHTRLCSKLPLECKPAITTDLVDEHEHKERAGLGQEHHDEAVHDGQAPASASSKHRCLWSTTLFRH